MSHEQLRALVPAYAAGELDAEEAAAMRAHLAAGCADCLHEVFRRPVGTPRPVPVPSAAGPPRAPRRHGGMLVVAMAVGVGVAAVAVWTRLDLQRREAAVRVEVERLTARLEDVEGERAELAARAGRLDRELAATQAEARAQAEAARLQAEAARGQEETSRELRAELEGAQARIGTLIRGVRRRDGEIGRLLAGLDGPAELRAMVAVPGLEVVQLRAVAPFRDPYGHVLWNPRRSDVVLYAFDLPALPAGVRYRVRFRLDDGRVEGGPLFAPDQHGAAVLPVRLGAGAEHLQEVEVVLDPAAQPVLAGRARAPAG